MYSKVTEVKVKQRKQRKSTSKQSNNSPRSYALTSLQKIQFIGRGCMLLYSRLLLASASSRLFVLRFRLHPGRTSGSSNLYRAAALQEAARI
jgi:hypothetical protein